MSCPSGRSVEGILGLQGDIRAVLHFQDDRRLDDFHRMPLTGGYVDSVFPCLGIQKNALHGTSHAVIEDHEHAAAENGVGLGRMAVPVNRDGGTRLQGVEQALGLGLQRVMKVQVHPQAGTLPGPGFQVIEKCVVEYHDFRLFRYSACRW